MMFVKGHCVIMTFPVETPKSEQLQNKEFKLTSYQTLLVNLFCWFGFFFPFELSRIFDILFDCHSEQINKHDVMPSQEKGNRGVSSMHVCGWWLFSDRKGGLHSRNSILPLSSHLIFASFQVENDLFK